MFFCQFGTFSRSLASGEQQISMSLSNEFHVTRNLSWDEASKQATNQLTIGMY
jgi:hypothetical protein